ncbi:MAG: hypothetical protein KDC87_06370 [Planctomycetes bacterium]|nr:hypothetical protein [Planctomycetota bacterium]MCB9872296.1 hypothetical protein [Planctomycetota bacterium]
MRPLQLVCALVAALCTLAAAPAQVHVVGHRWGFDNTATPGSFNLLTLEVRNDTSSDYDGGVTVYPVRSLMDAGVQHTIRCFLRPGEARQVATSVWLADATAEARVHVLGGKLLEIMPPKVGGTGAQVLLVPKNATPTAGLQVHAYDETTFPSSLAALDTLRGVVLDHVPEMLEAQRRTLIDWLHAGGTVHVFQDIGGFPRFDGDLAVLSGEQAEQRVGAGCILRYSRTLTSAPYTLRKRSAASLPRPVGLHAIAQRLGEVLRPEHNWLVIYLLITAFFVATVPVLAYLQQRLGPLTNTAILLALVAVFSWAIVTVGRRGYGERSRVLSVSHIRGLGRGRFDVCQWKSVFSTTSQRYAIHHDAGGSTYAAPGPDRVSAFTPPGRTALLLDVPLFTAQPFLHRGTFTGDPVAVTSDTDERGSKTLRWDGPKVLRAYLVRSGQVTTLRVRGNELVDEGAATDPHVLMAQTMYVRSGRARRSVQAQIADQAISALLAAEFPRQVRRKPTRRRSSSPTRLLVFCDPPQQLAAKGEGVGEETGVAIYDLMLEAD